MRRQLGLLETVCAKSTVDAGMCTTDKATYCEPWCFRVGGRQDAKTAECIKATSYSKCLLVAGGGDCEWKAPVPAASLPKAWYDCSYKGFRSCDDNSVCSSDGGKTVCAKSTVDAGKCTTDKATYCGDTYTSTPSPSSVRPNWP